MIHVYKPDWLGMDSCAGRATAALCEYFTTAGIEHTLTHPRDWNGHTFGDLAIVNGWEKKLLDGFRVTTRNQIVRAYREKGLPVLCIERGFLGDRCAWHGFSINGFAGSDPVGEFRIPAAPGPDRWEKVAEATGVRLRQVERPEDGYILLCAQVPWDAQVDQGNHLAWLEQAAERIAALTDREIRFRPHPKAYRRRDPYGGLSARFCELTRMKRAPTGPVPATFEDDLSGAWAVCCWNSNVAVLCNTIGVPVFTDAPCLADPLARRDWESMAARKSVAGPGPEAQAAWAHQMAYRQWHTDEFRSGEAWRHIMGECGGSRT